MYEKKFFAPNGQNGSGKFCYGKKGDDLRITVPCGTVIKDAESGKVLADMLDRNAIFNQIPEKALKACKRVWGKEPNYRKKYAAECDVIFAVLKADSGKV